MCEHHHHVHEEENNERIILSRIVLAILLFITAMLFTHSTILKCTVLGMAYLIAGYDIIFKALKNIIKGQVFDENFLMGIATLGAIGIKEYPEAVMVMVLYQIGEYLQDKAVEKSQNSITELMDIRPDYANIKKDGDLIKISPYEVKIGDTIIVKTGEKIPLDGIIIDGTATLDTSALTGESRPREVKIGDEAISGCINTNGLLKIRVTKEYGQSTVSKILDLVENASSKKTKTENFITKFAKIYTPVVVLAALFLAILPPLIFGSNFSVWINRALTFLVISCPCALVISVPLGFFAGIGGASKCGILVKGSSYLELLSKPETIVFDKTGTLTQGCFKVVKIVQQEGTTKEELLELTAYAESYSNHPIALSIKKAYDKSIDKNKISEISEIAGNGVRAEINGCSILVGNENLLKNHNINYQKANETGTIVYTAKNSKFLGYIVISDELKEDAQKAIIELKKLKLQTVMLTGDTEESGLAVAKKLNLDKAYTQLLPIDKVDKIEDIIEQKTKNKSVIFVGDGINDAPVLTRADVGIAMGGLGSDAAIEAADVVIMDDKPTKVATAIKIAKQTLMIVKENIAFALGIKVLFLILGAFGFVTMWGAVFADVGVTLIAVLNSLRALKIK
ncbi:MAG TPA: cadmium-translocating P-type ATPase [Cyanobacteria bacterium UBA10660]|nr:MAG TPA: cadmium-translocating P-type ATPase [Candidatus Gastranaerophilales bacterium HUM_1]HAS93317.1 cadmium-translocating P-type ATPase [Cyanobacteria bacterium UBA10660]